MTHALWTIFFVTLPCFLLLGVAMEFWNQHDRAGAVGYAVMIVLMVLAVQTAWEMTG